MTNPNDAIRDAILRYLYEVHKTAKGMKKVGIGIRELQKAMKMRCGYKQAEVVSNLDYLVQRSWVAKVTEARAFRTEKGTVQPEPKVT